MKKILLTSILTLGISAGASAQNLDSTYGDWNVFTDGSGTCYMASTPIKEDGNYSRRGQPYVLLNFKPGHIDEINVSSAYPYKSDVDVELKIDKNKYRLFTQGEHAWAKDSATDKSILEAMKKGSTMIAKGISRKGTYSIDTYSLKGTTAAYDRLKSICK